MIFDIKPDLTRKARFVAGGHLTEVPSILTYTSEDSQDSICILLVIAALNKISSMDVQGAFLYANPKEKAYLMAGDEFGSDKGKLIVVVRALYGLKSSRVAFRQKLSEDQREMGYRI